MCNIHTVCRWEGITVVHCYKAATMGLCDKPLNNRVFTDLNKQKYDNTSHPLCNGSFWI